MPDLALVGSSIDFALDTPTSEESGNYGGISDDLLYFDSFAARQEMVAVLLDLPYFADFRSCFLALL